MKPVSRQIENFLEEISFLWNEKNLNKQEVQTILDEIKEELFIINQLED